MAKGIWKKYQGARGSLEALIGEKLTEIHREVIEKIDK